MIVVVGATTKKVQLLLRKIGGAEYMKFVNHILPRKTDELSFDNTVL